MLLRYSFTFILNCSINAAPLHLHKILMKYTITFILNCSIHIKRSTVSGTAVLVQCKCSWPWWPLIMTFVWDWAQINTQVDIKYDQNPGLCLVQAMPMWRGRCSTKSMTDSGKTELIRLIDQTFGPTKLLFHTSSAKKYYVISAVNLGKYSKKKRL